VWQFHLKLLFYYVRLVQRISSAKDFCVSVQFHDFKIPPDALAFWRSLLTKALLGLYMVWSYAPVSSRLGLYIRGPRQRRLCGLAK
ncbi:hypothetical protein NC651_020887, partial [Populus alba x Populus x berolinensis]